MNQVKLNNFHESSSDVPLKRKRGRPRKFPKPNVDDNAQISKNQNLFKNLNFGVHSQVHPLSNGATLNPSIQRDPVDNANKDMIGQVVSGVVEAVFEAGFLLSVKVGDSDTTLRGVVFRPGRYVPISSENDVAPDVQMIKRNEVPFPSGAYTQGDSSHWKKRNEQNVKSHRYETNSMIGLPTANQVSRVAGSSSMVPAKGKQVPVVAEQTVLPAGGGGILPVGHQNSVSLKVVSDQPPLVVSQGSHMPSTKGKEIQESSHPANRQPAVSQVPLSCSQSPCSQPQPSSSDGMQNEECLHQPSSEGQRELEVKTMVFPSMPFDKLVYEAFKMVPPPSQTIDSELENSKSSVSTLAKAPKFGEDNQANSMCQTPSSMPIQTPQPHLEGQSAAACKAPETHKKDRMNELLQVLQDERENHERQSVQVPTVLDTEVDDEEIGQSNKRFRASVP